MRAHILLTCVLNRDPSEAEALFIIIFLYNRLHVYNKQLLDFRTLRELKMLYNVSAFIQHL